MAGKVARGGVLLLLASLALGVSGAGGRPLATTTVLIQVDGRGTVSGGGQINCGDGNTSCYATYVSGENVTITAAPSPGWTFTGWDSSDDCSGTGSSCTVPLNGTAHEEIAEFAHVPPVGDTTLTVDPEPTGGSVVGGDIDCGTDTDDCDTDVPEGSTVTLVETPDSGYTFSGWGGVCSGTAVSCTITMDDDKDVTASFTQSAATHVLTVSVTGNGTVTGGGIACTSAGGSGCTATEPANSQVTLTATPGSGSSFIGWGGSCAGTALTCTITMTGDLSVSAAFTGGTGGTVPLTVSVTGSGRVTGGGINCGDGGTVCNVDLATGSSVTLTATPSSGATFQGWAGACSGSATTCTITMNSAKAVSATFSAGGGGPPPNTVPLTLRVTGSGSVSAPGGTCSSDGSTKTCTQTYQPGTSVVLTARAQTGARFVSWGGACSGTAATCTLTLNSAATVTATFTGSSGGGGGGGGGSSGGALRSLGRPVIARAKTGFAVTLRFTTAQQGTARVRAFRAGRLITAFSFSVPAGAVTVGPFSVPSPGYYTFRLALGSRGIAWRACLGRCGERAAAPPFTLIRETPSVIDAGAAWSVTVNFRTTLPADIEFRVYRSGTLAVDERSARPAGRLSVGPILLSPGDYTLRLTATDGFGRVRTLVWFAFLP